MHSLDRSPFHQEDRVSTKDPNKHFVNVFTAWGWNECPFVMIPWDGPSAATGEGRVDPSKLHD